MALMQRRRAAHVTQIVGADGLDIKAARRTATRRDGNHLDGAASSLLQSFDEEFEVEGVGDDSFGFQLLDRHLMWCALLPFHRMPSGTLAIPRPVQMSSLMASRGSMVGPPLLLFSYLSR